MSQVSKYPVSKDVAERMFAIFIKTLLVVKERNEAQNFVSDLFTPTEKIMFAKRLAIAFLLRKGYQYRQICKVLRVSLGTIATVNFSLQNGKSGYESILKKIENEENMELYFKEVLEKIVSIPAALPKGGGAWRYLKQEIQKEKRIRKKGF